MKIKKLGDKINDAGFCKLGNKNFRKVG